MNRRVVIIVLDSVGVGQLPDSCLYGDDGSNTLANTARAVGGLTLPNLEGLGLGKIIPVSGVSPVPKPLAAFGKMAEQSPGKDTTTGHWEMAGIVLKQPFPTYPKGFPQEIIGAFEERIGTKTLGNVAASGTEIIKELGEDHLKTGYPIVYTSADSVFQIAAHEKVIPPGRLYEICRIARDLLVGKHAVARVIARPFDGLPGEFFRTTRRHDFSLEPPGETMLDLISGAGQEVIGIGKISDIFVGKGLTKSFPTKNNEEGINITIQSMEQCTGGLIFTNLVDFDMVYGHRNNPEGYARALEYFDARIPELMEYLQEEDLLIITADHGTDPTTESTDHSREYVPLLICGKPVKNLVCLGIRSTFADLGATVVDYLGCGTLKSGISMLGEIITD